MKTVLSLNIVCKFCEAQPGEYCFPERKMVHLGRVERKYELEWENHPDGGGWVEGPGLTINWQVGSRKERPINGAIVEEVIKAVVQRIEYYETTELNCYENVLALAALEDCLEALADRKKRMA